jgi:F-type H+-transporting ATPase subunit epsilon
MAKVSVEIVTPEKRLLQAQVDEAIIPGAKGLFGVRPGHAPFLSVMEPGPLTLKDAASGTQTFFVAGGFVTVGGDKVLVLADQAEVITAIDVESARARLEEAQKRLVGMSAEDARFEVESATVRRETVRMAVARRS